MDGELESYQIILLAIALLVYMLYELMTTKKVKGMFKSLSMFFIPVLAAFVFMGSVYATSKAINSIKPDADDISGVCILSNVYNGSSYEHMHTNGIIINSPEANEIISEALVSYINQTTNNNDYYHTTKKFISVIIKLDSGRKIGRRFYVSSTEYEKLLTCVTESEEYKEKLITLPDDDMIHDISIGDIYYDLNSSKSPYFYIWKSFVEEYNSLSDDEKAEYKLKISIKSYNTSNSPLIRVNGYYNSREYFSSSYPLLPEYTPKTLALVAKLMNNSYVGSDPESKFDEYYDGLTKALKEDYNELSLNITVQQSGDAYDYIRYTTSLNPSALEGYENIVKFLSESDSAIFDFENAEKRPCKIELSADIYSYYSEYDEKYSETKYYNHLNAYIMLTDEEMKKIIAYTEKGIVPDFDIEK
jgi:hypothetical protein